MPISIACDSHRPHWANRSRIWTARVHCYSHRMSGGLVSYGSIECASLGAHMKICLLRLAIGHSNWFRTIRMVFIVCVQDVDLIRTGRNIVIDAKYATKFTCRRCACAPRSIEIELFVIGRSELCSIVLLFQFRPIQFQLNPYPKYRMASLNNCVQWVFRALDARPDIRHSIDEIRCVACNERRNGNFIMNQTDSIAFTAALTFRRPIVALIAHNCSAMQGIYNLPDFHDGALEAMNGRHFLPAHTFNAFELGNSLISRKWNV